MAYVLDLETREITISAGDTMDFSVNVSGKDYDAALFAVYNPVTGKDVVVVPAQLSTGKCGIRLANRHTRDVAAGRYKWNIRLVTDPVMDDAGNIVVDDDSDNVFSVFGPDPDDVPDFVVRRTGAYV